MEYGKVINGPVLLKTIYRKIVKERVKILIVY